MCGIYGAVHRDPASVLSRMGQTLIHRGPDGNGVAVRGRGGLGCRRLAIIDVQGGAQPIANEDGTVIAVCNGEIYNHATLRAGLERRGHVFRTRSDAEVIPHLYEERGADCVDDLAGMFAFAIWDSARERLLLARDRMGEKPLYYAATSSGVLFGSEPKAILASGEVSAAPDWGALSVYLRKGYVPNPRTAFGALQKLPPAGRLTVGAETIAADRYWDVVPFLADPPVPVTLEHAAIAVRRRLEDAVEAAMVSDVPLGVFLSGGLDSTAVAAVAVAVAGELATFALRFEVPGFDEGEYAALAARRLGTRHRTLTITPASFLDGVLDLVPLVDEPLADPAFVPTFLLARFARTEVKTVLVGEGADELFAGYPSYIGAALASRYANAPAWVRRLLHGAAPTLGGSQGNTTLRYLLRRFIEAADAPAAVRHETWMGCFDAERLAALATPGGPLGPVDDAPTLAARTEIDGLLGLDLRGYLADDLLPKLDRGTMAASLEGRAPYLDHRLVEFVCRLSIDLKLRGLATKRVLRRAVADLVPDRIRHRVKRGLTVPLAAWLAGPLLPFARATLDRIDPRVLRPDGVRALLDEHVARRRDNRRELWALIMLRLWQDRWTSRGS